MAINKNRVKQLAATENFTGSIYKVCSTHVTDGSVISENHFGSFNFTHKDTYPDSVGSWSGSAYTSSATDLNIPTGQCMETDMIALYAKTNGVLVYYKVS